VLTRPRPQTFHVAKGKTMSKYIVNGSGQARARSGAGSGATRRLVC
jgi:hypothetical protein